jgi:hypothetical protein
MRGVVRISRRHAVEVFFVGSFDLAVFMAVMWVSIVLRVEVRVSMGEHGKVYGVEDKSSNFCR